MTVQEDEFAAATADVLNDGDIGSPRVTGSINDSTTVGAPEHRRSA